MSQQHRNVPRTRLHNDGPEFPHSFTFSDQRYVPRPRPIAHINLPSHHRSQGDLRPEALSSVVALSHSESLQPLLRLVHEREDVDGFTRNITWVQRLVYLSKRIVVFVNMVKKRIMGALKVVWLKIRQSFGC